MLDREVPLSRNGRLEVGLPHAKIGTLIRIGRRCSNDTLIRCCSRQGNIVVMRYDLGRGPRRIQCQTQVCAGTLKIGRDGESAADNRFPIQNPGRPGKGEARLKIPSTILAIIECPAVAILAGKLNSAAEESVICLLVILLHPRSGSFVTHANVQRQVIGNTPVVLNISGKGGRALPPAATRDTTIDSLRQSEEEVCL